MTQASSSATYLMPIRCDAAADDAELDLYLRWVAERTELIIVDGSSPSVFAEHARHWATFSIHIPVQGDLAGSNGKVRGVLTGLRRATYDRVIIADDDVRYDEATLQRVLDDLAEADLVAPQNFFDPRPWHAQWDSARSLINRAFGADPPGTMAVRRSALPPHGYDAHVLFENLELMRTVAASGGRVVTPLDCFVRRVPPTTRHFASQRVRQSYDEFARPLRLAVGLCVLPIYALLARRSTRRLCVVAIGVPIALAQRGRCRMGGGAHFDRRAVLFAPLWVAERGLCSWLALYWRLRGGCPYSSTRIAVAAHSPRHLRKVGQLA